MTSPSADRLNAEWWNAPAVSGPIDAELTLPGSKSLTNRLLLLAALGDRPTTIVGALDSDDSTAMRSALVQLGAGLEETEVDGEPALHVTPLSLRPAPPEHRVIDVNQAGTVMRFIPVIAALIGGTTDFLAHESALARPMGPLFNALRSAGAHALTLSRDTAGAFTAVGDDDAATLPARIVSVEAASGAADDTSRDELAFEVDASTSSQFLSALLLGVNAQSRPARIRHIGGRIPSRAHVSMTVETLRDFGVVVDEIGENEWRVTPGVTSPEIIRVEQDLSNAGPFLAAAMVTGGRVRVPGWPLTTTQIGDRWREILVQLGATVNLEVTSPDAGTLTVTGPERILPADIDDSAELAPVLAALLALAEGTSRLSGIAHLRGHETDRLAALAHEMTVLGAKVEETEDGLIIQGTRSPQAADHLSYHDHRMATAAALWGLVAPGTRVESIGVTAKTMPSFPEMWARVAATAPTAFRAAHSTQSDARSGA
jgi:3-phosphoshikimate 1-carboxyvinyltransferase